MKKRFLSVIVLKCRTALRAGTRGKRGYQPRMLGQIKQSYQGTAADKALRNAIGNNDIRQTGTQPGEYAGHGYPPSPSR